MGSNPSFDNTVSCTVHALFTRDSYIILYCTYTENPGFIHKKRMHVSYYLKKKNIVFVCTRILPFYFVILLFSHSFISISLM